MVQITGEGVVDFFDTHHKDIGYDWTEDNVEEGLGEIQDKFGSSDKDAQVFGYIQGRRTSPKNYQTSVKTWVEFSRKENVKKIKTGDEEDIRSGRRFLRKNHPRTLGGVLSGVSRRRARVLGDFLSAQEKGLLPTE